MRLILYLCAIVASLTVLTASGEYSQFASTALPTFGTNNTLVRNAELTSWPFRSLSRQSSVQSKTSLHLPLIARGSIGQPFPESGSTDRSINSFLSWVLGDPSLTHPRYELYLAPNDPSVSELIADNIVHLNYDPPTLELDTQYFWRVVAIDADGRRIEGPVWTFRTEKSFDPVSVGTMVKVPAGEFRMGCDRTVEPCRFDETHQEEPLHAVYLDTYEIDKYEVTNSEYARCVATGICNPPRRLNSRTHENYFGNPTYALFPVLYVSQSDAITYCKWVGKRLPTEAEWEKAARGAIDTRRWPWGKEREDCTRMAIVRGEPCPTLEDRDMVRIGMFPRGASPYGVMDMAGNAFEWVSDKYNIFYYEVSPYYNPPGPEISMTNRTPISDKTTYYTIRGGSNVDNWYYMRVVHRHFGHWGDEPNTDTPHFRSFRVGFRCARSEDY